MELKTRHGPIRYEVSGPVGGTPVVFTSGITMELAAFDAQVAALGDRFRIVRWDLPGHGGSFDLEGRPFSFDLATECLLGLLDELQIDAAVLVGLSLGSLIHQYLAHHHPHRVRALVDVGGLPLHHGMDRLSAFVWRMLASTGHWLPSKTYYRLFAKERAVTSDARRTLEEGIAKMGKRRVTQLTLDFLADQARGIPVPPEQPLLIINGEHEISFVRKRSVKWHREIKGSKRVEIPEAGHVANLDQPSAFNRSLVDFLRAHSAPS
jgi:pimeloyl-ACP methyl ester carboxylesterase